MIRILAVLVVVLSIGYVFAEDHMYYKLVDVAGVHGCVEANVSSTTASAFGGKLGTCERFVSFSLHCPLVLTLLFNRGLPFSWIHCSDRFPKDSVLLHSSRIQETLKLRRNRLLHVQLKHRMLSSSFFLLSLSSCWCSRR